MKKQVQAGIFLFCFMLTLEICAQTKNSVSPIDSTVSTEIQPNGDTLFHFKRDHFDLGDVYKPPGKRMEMETDSVKSGYSAFNPSSTDCSRRINEDINEDKAVGAILYTEGETPTGGKTYSVPIAIASVPGEAPSISLHYNSQQGRGLAGIGWEIGGISDISIADKTLYYDGEVKASDIRNSDVQNVFVMDGIRLIPATISPFRQNQYLETARGQVMLKPYYVNNHVAYFTALFPNGNQAVYGFPSTTSPQYTYPISSVTDSRGYRTDYEYLDYKASGNKYIISKIRYGSKEKDSHPATVEFIYENSSVQTAPVYISGVKISFNNILKKIVSSVDGTELRTYTLSHTTEEVDLLAQIDCSVGNSSLNPLIFSYGDETSSAPATLQKDQTMLLSSYFDGSQALVYMRGQFRNYSFGDGLIIYPKFNTYDITATLQKPFGKKYYQYGSKYSPDQNLLVTPVLDYLSHVETIKAEDGFQLLTAVDTNGDGADELVKINFGQINGDRCNLKITVYSFGSTSALSSYTFQIPLMGVVEDGGLLSPISRTYQFGDFDGNGKIELLTVSSDKTFRDETRDSYFSLIDLDSGSLLLETTNFPGVKGWLNNFYTLDYDGDGKTDFCHITGSSTDIYTFKIEGSQYSIVKEGSISQITANSIASKELFIADYNGDGKSDFVVSPLKSTLGIRHIIVDGPTGTCSTTYRLMQPGEHPDYDSLIEQYPVGRFIIMVCEEDPNVYLIEDAVNFEEYVQIDRGTGWSIFLSTGGTPIFQLMKYNDGPRVYSNSGTKYLFQDMDKDGYPDLIELTRNRLSLFLQEQGQIDMYEATFPKTLPESSKLIPVNVVTNNNTSQLVTLEGAKVVSYTYTADESKKRLLTEMRDSYGLIRQNSYSDMTSKDGIYLKGTKDRAYPYSYFIAPLTLLHTTTAYMGSSIISTKSYLYHGAVTHRTGLGFCGFERVDVADGVNSITASEYKAPDKYGITSRTVSPLNEAIYTYNLNQNGCKANPRILSSTETDKLKNITVETRYKYDAFYNPTEVEVDYSNGLRKVSIRDYENSISENKYLTGLLKREEETRYRGGQNWKMSKEMTYTPEGLPLSKITKVPGGKIEETRWTYDQGKVMSEKQAPYDVTEFLGDTYTYNGRFVSSSTNAMGQKTTFADYTAYGKPCKVTDYKGRVNQYTYDLWGTELSVTDPTGAVKAIAVAWGGQGLYTITTTETGKPDKIVHYDALGREVRIGIRRFDGSWLYTDKVYDTRGRLIKESLPFKTSPALWNIFNYDTYNRLKEMICANGKKDSYTYNNNSVTETRNGITTTKIYDASGELISVTDPGGTINYTLRPDGQPENVVSPGNVVTSFEYDNYGRKTAINDPSAGRQTYSDSYVNNLLVRSVTDANGMTNTTKYDKYGRVIEVNRPEFDTSYSYNADGLMESEVSGNGTSKTFVYDHWGRLIYDKQTVYNNWLQHNYGYANGVLEARSYVTSKEGALVTENYTYVNGHMTEIKLNGQTSIWKLVEENDLGQRVKTQTGPLTRTFSYTSIGMPTVRTARNSAGFIQNFYCNFDPQKGNLLSRTDNTRGLTEMFGYDHLNRLNVMGSKQVVYANNGNIKSMPGVGTMKYEHPDKPYAVTGLSYSGNLVNSNRHSVIYTSFQRPRYVFTDPILVDYEYNASGERVKMYTTPKGPNVPPALSIYLDRTYIGGYEIHDNKQILYLGGNAYSASAVYVKERDNEPWKIHYICRDYLGSITHITDANGVLKEEQSFDAWGRMRDPQTHDLFPENNGVFFSNLLGRGYTGHEHIPYIGLINMNARLYDPMLGRFLSPDPYVQLPDFTQSFNRYGYCLNNPLIYVDKDGEFFWSFVFYWLLFTESGYEVQKYISPIALHIDLRLGTHQKGIGFDFSVGGPKLLPVSYRFHYGKTYFWETYGGRSGTEVRKGGEWTALGLFSFSGTTFSDTNYPIEQTTYMVTLGTPFSNIKYENDTYLSKFRLPGMPAGNKKSDGYRTAAARIKFGPFSIGMILHTGYTSNPMGDAELEDLDGDGIPETRIMKKGDIEDSSQSHGVLYFGFGPFKIGRDSEGIRHLFQNKLAHDGFNGGSRGSGYPWVKPFWDRSPQWFIQFGGSNGSTLY